MIRRSSVPASYREVTTRAPQEADAKSVGIAPRAVEWVWEAVEALYGSGIHPAIQLCVRVRGQVLIDRAIGHARGNGPPGSDDGPPTPVTPNTPFVALSASKAVTAMVVHGLVERGVLHLDDAVCKYLPEFGRHGKDRITVRHLLAHRAGIPMIPAELMTLDRLGNPDSIREMINDLVPATRPGAVLAYHALSAGFVLAELVAAATGHSIGDALDEIIRSPLGFRGLAYGVPAADVEQVARNYYTGVPVLSLLSARFRRILGYDFADVPDLANDPRFLQGTVPSANIVATANELSRFYQLLLDGGTLDGVRVFEPGTIRRAVAEQSYLELDRTLGLPIRYGLGFMLGGRWVSFYGPDTEQAFGHLGFTNIIAWADPQRDVAAALLTSGKPLLHPALAHVLDIPRRIGLATARVG